MGNVTGWMLNGEDRAMLLARFAPMFAHVIADHVTLDGDAGPDAVLPLETRGEVVGITDDGGPDTGGPDAGGVQALVIAIGGTTDRPDGSTYHSAWSIDAAAGRHAIESNDVIRRYGWRAIEPAIPVHLIPAWLPDWR